MPQLAVTSAKDSSMNGPSPDTNYGASDTISMGILIAGGSKSQLFRAIVNFDLAALPAGAVVQSAKMQRALTLIDPDGHACRILRCVRASQWTENGVTWNKYDGVNPWTAAGGDWDASTPAPISYIEPLALGVHEIYGLGQFVSDAIAQRGGIVSLIMKNDDEAPNRSQRSQWLAGSFWKLVIDYNQPALPAGLEAPATSSGRRPARPRHAALAAAPHQPERPRFPRRDR